MVQLSDTQLTNIGLIYLLTYLLRSSKPIWKYYGFYSDTKGDLRILHSLSNLCKRQRTCRLLIFLHVWVHHPSKAAKLSQDWTANNSGAVSQNTHRHTAKQTHRHCLYVSAWCDTMTASCSV